LRAANFLAEGVDVLLSTDHEYIFDYAPVVQQLGAQDFIATMVGEEVTSFTHGHFNAFPLTRDDSVPNGGAFDHAGGEDAPSLRMPQVFAGIKEKWPAATVQLNHPRSSGGSLTLLKVETATLASKGDPAAYNMAPAPDATANDTRLFGDGFDLVEVANGPSPTWAVMNDWMTFLSRGTVRASSGVSDSHSSFSDTGGYARTWAKVGTDSVTAFSPQAFSDAVKAQKLFASNGPILSFTAQKLDGSGNPTGPVVDIGGTISAANGEKIRFTVDVQGLEWMQIDRVELYSHAPGREAAAGVENSEWPEGRILQKKDLDTSAVTLEPVAGAGNLRRVHITETFEVTVTGDTWFVGMARSLNGRSMSPLHGQKPMAWSNAILVDGDGSGAYDDFPLKPGQPLTAVPKEKGPVIVPTREQFVQAIADLILHGDEH
ncbi:MAG: CehA/McbA family metallohydrolase, partial [Archangium sp.]